MLLAREDLREEAVEFGPTGRASEGRCLGMLSGGGGEIAPPLR